MSVKRFVWDNIPFDTCHIETVGDGNCLFHAICNAFYKPYRTEMIDGVKISRLEIVAQFRSELASMLEEKDPNDKYGRTRYETLGGGVFKELANSGRKEYILASLQESLRSNSPMGDEIVPFIGQIIYKSLLFLDTRTRDVYVLSDLPPDTYTHIVMLYNGQHYDLCAIHESDNSMSTYFTPLHPFIIYIRNRIQQYKDRSL